MTRCLRQNTRPFVQLFQRVIISTLTLRENTIIGRSKTGRRVCNKNSRLEFTAVWFYVRKDAATAMKDAATAWKNGPLPMKDAAPGHFLYFGSAT